MELLNVTEARRAMSENQDGFDGLIEGLEPLVRATVVLSYMWGLTAKEIGHTLGLNPQQVGQKLSLAHRIIKSRIKSGRE